MPQNKSAIIRYQTLDRCFRNPNKKYYINDLIDECSDAIYGESRGKKETISRRTIYADIEFMKSHHGYNAPIENHKEGRNAYMRYSDISFSINNQPLNEDETLQLRDAIIFLSRLSGREEFSIINDILPKLQGDILSGDHLIKPIISYEENKYLKNKEHLGELFNAIRDERVLELKYKSFKSDKAEKLEFHPYFLKQYNNRWFLFGYCEEKFEQGIHPLNLAIDRIEKIGYAKTTYIPNDTIDFDSHFDDVIGVTIPNQERPTKITIRVDPNYAPYLESKALHPSQKRIKIIEGDLQTTIEIIPNYEMYSQLLALGSNIEVIAPQEVRIKMKNLIEKMEIRYR
jgi:predicted DNA-binding transcriptional regulator YafY